MSRGRLDHWSLLFLCEKGLNLLLSLSVFFILRRFLISELLAPIPSQPNCWHQFQFAGIDSLFVDSFTAQSPHVCFSSPISASIYVFFFYNSISTSAKKMRTLLFAVFNVNRWWTLECCYHDSVCVWFDAY
jgi:hypothetical protein